MLTVHKRKKKKEVPFDTTILFEDELPKATLVQEIVKY